jgi:OOP family OmpA-OmpF porin
MNTKLISALAFAGIFSTSTMAIAEEAYQGSWYVLPTIGAMHADSELDTDGTDAAYGIRLGKQISEHWDVQLGVTHSKSDIDLPAGFNGDDEYKQTLIGLDALYMFSRDKFRPFVLAGLGMARNSIDTVNGFNNNVDEDNWSWMANVGVGAQYLFTETIGMQADLRHVWSRAEAPNGSVAPDFHDEETVGNTYFNLGLLINFGAPKKVAVAPEPAPEPVVAPEPVAEPAPEPVAEPAPEPQVQGPDEPAFVKMTLQAEVLFGFDKDVLTSEGKQILDVEVVEKMKAHPEVELVLISGHTDRIGTDQYNQNLSERRANNVKKYLAAQGIEENRLHAVGQGEKMPVVDCKGIRGKKLIQCLQPNRRVVVEIEVQRQVAP